MALFSRRYLWYCLQKNAAFASVSQRNNWLSRLDEIRDDYVATEWEITLLSAFSQFGNVQHEPDTNSRIDMLFSNKEISFAADITTAFDWPLHKKNPVESLVEELDRRIRKEKLKGGFFCEIAEKKQNTLLGSGNKRSLLLPPVNVLSKTIFDRDWDHFVGRIKNQPNSSVAHHILRNDPAVDLRITYEPKKHGTSYTHGTYTSANVIDDNPLYNCLDRKAYKLKQQKYSRPVGIIVCDGGCRMLTDPSRWGYSVPDVVSEFFRQHRSIQFVMIIAIKDSLGFTTLRSTYRLLPTLFLLPGTALQRSELERLMNGAISSLPEIMATPANAARLVKHEGRKRTRSLHIGGWERCGDIIKLSVLELLHLMAGKLDQTRFVLNHDLGNGVSQFARLMLSGYTIRDAVVERQNYEDDDWLRLTFAKTGGAARSFEQSKIVDGNTISVRADQVLGLLAGLMKQKDFLSFADDVTDNFFVRRIGSGEMITEAFIQQEIHQSPSWVSFKFGSPDPALVLQR